VKRAPISRIRPRPGDGLEQLLAERGDHLMRAALALTGRRQEAEDLLQTSLERLLRRWERIEDPESYLRRTLYNLAADGWRRRGAWRAKVPLIRVQANSSPSPDPITTLDLRDALARDLLLLPARQRAVLVLRYWEQLSQAETAELLGCSEGTVKSAASRGLQRLRDLAAAREAAEAPAREGQP
jgi:RNA polymerase sigma-70 factor (sigma-E family)